MRDGLRGWGRSPGVSRGGANAFLRTVQARPGVIDPALTLAPGALRSPYRADCPAAAGGYFGAGFKSCDSPR
jgi:hypothetical protein